MIRGHARRRAQLEIDDTVIGQARDLAMAALDGGGALKRGELLAVWDSNGVATTGQRGYHLLAHLAITGTVCLGPLRDGEQLIVLTDEWIRAPRRLDRNAALGELADRYFCSHGPAAVTDFSRWTGLLSAEVRAAMQMAAPELDRIEVAGVEYFMDPQTPQLLKAHRGHAEAVFLLPGFDEFVLGYGDRTAMLPVEFATRIVPGGNGVFNATVVSGGQIVCTWRHAGRSVGRTLDATALTTFSADVEAGLGDAYAALPG